MHEVLVRSNAERNVRTSNRPRFRDSVRNILNAPFARASGVDALWQLTTMPLSLSVSAIVLGLVLRVIRPS